MKEKPGDITILQICNVNNNLVMYGSWDMERDGHNILILGHFLPFFPTNNPKIKILKKWKQCLEILSFYIVILYHFLPFYPTNKT